MTLIIVTIAAICSKWNITPEQFDKATYCSTNGQGFYIVESQTTDAEYHVKYNRQFGKLTCTCKAGQQGTPCWHERSALANQEHYKATRQAQRLQEQTEVEVTAEYQLDQLFNDLEDALANLDRIAAEADERDRKHEAVLRAQA